MTDVAIARAFPLLADTGHCPVCRASGLLPLHVYVAKGRYVIGRRRSLALVGCETCGVAFSHPLPSQSELDAHYADSYWDDRDERLVDDPGGEPDERSEAVTAELRRRPVGHFRLLAPHLSFPETGPRKALDFGCGQGYWLDVLKADGWQTEGLEPSASARAIAAREHSMIDAIPDEPTYDLVILSHVLEHLREPLKTATRISAALRPGGCVFVGVPDFSRLPRHRKFSYITNGVHIFSFTVSALRSLLGLAGLELLARFDQPEWDDVAHGEHARMKCLARKAPAPVRPSGRPLDEAIESLRAYAVERAEKGSLGSRSLASSSSMQEAQHS